MSGTPYTVGSHAGGEQTGGCSDFSSHSTALASEEHASIGEHTLIYPIVESSVDKQHPKQPRLYYPYIAGSSEIEHLAQGRQQDVRTILPSPTPILDTTFAPYEGSALWPEQLHIKPLPDRLRITPPAWLQEPYEPFRSHAAGSVPERPFLYHSTSYPPFPTHQRLEVLPSSSLTHAPPSTYPLGHSAEVTPATRDPSSSFYYSYEHKDHSIELHPPPIMHMYSSLDTPEASLRQTQSTSHLPHSLASVSYFPLTEAVGSSLPVGQPELLPMSHPYPSVAQSSSSALLSPYLPRFSLVSPNPSLHSPVVNDSQNDSVFDYFQNYVQLEAQESHAPLIPQTFQSISPPLQRNEMFHAKAGASVRLKSKLAKSAEDADSAADRSKATKREVRSYDGKCGNCGKAFGNVYLRGTVGDFDTTYTVAFLCLECSPPDLDALLQDTTKSGPQSSSARAKTKANMSKKRTREANSAKNANCDVCGRIVASGGLKATTPENEIRFNMEIVCLRCQSRYARCSDCGGGGGVRLGVGKWRCKELFMPKRKTCSLSHARHASVTSMQYTVMRISDIPSSEHARIVDLCQAVFESSLLGSMAVPEVIERNASAVSCFADVQTLITNGWKAAREVLETDAEHTEGYRRYLGLRWAAPRPRKLIAVSDKKAAGASDTTEAENTSDQSAVLRPGKILSGYVSGEWHLTAGTLYITCVVPFTIGEQYEGSGHLITLMQKQAMQDREQYIHQLRTEGRSHEIVNVPPILHSFTMMFFTPGSKMLAFLEAKRQLLPLDRYLAKYPDTDPNIFPPHRRAYSDGGAQTVWTCLVRRLPPSPIR